MADIDHGTVARLATGGERAESVLLVVSSAEDREREARDVEEHRGRPDGLVGSAPTAFTGRTEA